MVDLTDSAAIKQAIEKFRPDCIINAAAYTAVDKAESEPEKAFQVNAQVVSVLAGQAKHCDAWLIHYSTDYVFDGTLKRPYSETDLPHPINVYGQSKLAGEEAIRASGCRHLIFRTSWVIGRHGKNFAKTILRLAQQRDSLQVIDDQNGVPTSTNLIARVTKAAVVAMATSKPWPTGLYHLTPHGQTTWYGIAQTLLRRARARGLLLASDENALHPIATSNYPTPARRPINSLLETSKLARLLHFDLPDWQDDFVTVSNAIISDNLSS